MLFRRFFSLLLAASSSVNVLGQTVQKPNLAVPESAAAQRLAVVKMFKISYTAYKFVGS